MTSVDLGMPDKMPPVSNSELGSFRDCRRKWMLEHIYQLALKNKAPKPGALGLGTKVHQSLEEYYRDGADPIDVLERQYTEDFTTLEKFEIENEVDLRDTREKLQKERELAHAMIEGYVAWIEETGADEGLQLAGVEEVIEVASGVDGVRVRGKLDQRLVREIDGTRLFLDFKTAADLKGPALIMPMNEQMKMYQLLEKLDSIRQQNTDPPEPTRGGLYRMLKKVKRTDRAQPPFYETLEVQHNDAELRSMWKRINRMISEMVEIREALENGGDHQYWAYPRPSRDCTWKCDFFPVCPLMDDGSDYQSMLDEYYVHQDPYERYAIEETKDGSTL